MTHQELDRQIGELALAFDKAPPAHRQALRPQISQIIRTLRIHAQPIPRQLQRIDEWLNFDAEEDLFDNMPV